MISIDSYYEIGAAHVFCQDHALHGAEEYKGRRYFWVALSDGCSSTQNSDIAARAMTAAFRQVMYSGEVQGGEKDAQETLLHNMSNVGFCLGMRADQLDATLGGFVLDETEDVLHSFLWGDGSILYKYHNGDSYLTDVRYKSNAPFYLSYLRNESRRAAYVKQFGYDYGTRQGYIVTPTKVEAVPETLATGIKFHYERYPDISKNLLFVSLFSDGIDTFHKKDDANLTMARHVLLSELAGYKSFHGEFVKRRMLAFKKQCARDGFIHDDDISVATIAFL